MRWHDALAGLLRPDLHPLLRMLDELPLTVADVVGPESPGDAGLSPPSRCDGSA